MIRPRLKTVNEIVDLIGSTGDTTDSNNSNDDLNNSSEDDSDNSSEDDPDYFTCTKCGRPDDSNFLSVNKCHCGRYFCCDCVKYNVKLICKNDLIEQLEIHADSFDKKLMEGEQLQPFANFILDCISGECGRSVYQFDKMYDVLNYTLDKEHETETGSINYFNNPKLYDMIDEYINQIKRKDYWMCVYCTPQKNIRIFEDDDILNFLLKKRKRKDVIKEMNDIDYTPKRLKIPPNREHL